MQRIERFCKTTRWFHWTFVLPFLGLAGTGATLALREQVGLAEDTTRTLVRVHEGDRAVLAAGTPAGAAVGADARGARRPDAAVPHHPRRPALARAPAARRARPRGAAARRQAQRRPEGERDARDRARASAWPSTGIWLWRRPGALVPWLVAPALFVGVGAGLRRPLLPRGAEPRHAARAARDVRGRRRPRLGAAPPPALGRDGDPRRERSSAGGSDGAAPSAARSPAWRWRMSRRSRALEPRS